ncbi:hypothetical protein SARC_00294 [Sphaeroforma arctica JP610]|uniref:Tricarboxylate transport protein n=1 Tax=Sphaeroforma arctica JP610 TaxID=667725 RepID=A0A0L0GGZ5_9EUKA|nr:hypothetical protein SARC_00294 [Sphaeroforma arctica JP610]KNC87593.1 hypothetical protein SARC_00294 [Sphaeroforma arctica JP610]|eukprot:XP_014161495.1 hypothetical protein SARC_00294 [Sphaeroforma arctica JP610]
MAPSESKKTRSPLQSILSGGISGGVEICMTYPTEFVKTQLQLDQRSATPKYKGAIDCARQTIKNKGFSGLYKGITPLLVGTIPKVASRFTAYEQGKALLADENGKLTVGRTFCAGLMAGATEAVLAVTPMETVKVKFIADQSLPNPRYKGLIHGVSTIVKEEGLSGIYKGVGPTIVKQASNQAIRFVVYNRVRETLCAKLELDASVPHVGVTMAAGVVAGTASVYGNTPIDVVKTRMQGLESKQYKNSFDCFKQIVQKEGWSALYKGATPRLSRVALDTAIVFTLYDLISAQLDNLFADK